MTELTDKNALVTGAASGLGRLIAKKLAARGARLVLWDVDAAGLDAVARELREQGHEVSAFVCDLSDKESIAGSARAVLADIGGIDVLVNNAGIVSGKRLLELSDANIERTFAINTLALFWCTRAFLPGMVERGHGHVVTLASAGGLVGTARMTDYCASKFAAVGFDEALRLELRREGSSIRTTVVCPFYVSTGMFAGVKTRFAWLLPILEPDRVAERVVAAIAAGRRRVVLPWFVYTVWPTRLLPVSWFDALMDFFGVNKSMDEFRGRG